MNLKSILGAACAAIAVTVAVPAAAHDPGKATPHFEHAIPNIPGKSLIALVVDYAPGGASTLIAVAISSAAQGSLTAFNYSPHLTMRLPRETLATSCASVPGRDQLSCGSVID